MNIAISNSYEPLFINRSQLNYKFVCTIVGVKKSLSKLVFKLIIQKNVNTQLRLVMPL